MDMARYISHARHYCRYRRVKGRGSAKILPWLHTRDKRPEENGSDMCSSAFESRKHLIVGSKAIDKHVLVLWPICFFRRLISGNPAATTDPFESSINRRGLTEPLISSPQPNATLSLPDPQGQSTVSHLGPLQVCSCSSCCRSCLFSFCSLVVRHEVTNPVRLCSN